MNLKLNPVRETFGVLDSQGNLYPDIDNYYIGVDSFLPIHLSLRTIWDKGTEYLLHMDSALKRALIEKMNTDGEKHQKVIISFQQRKTLNIALARIYYGNFSRIRIQK